MPCAGSARSKKQQPNTHDARGQELVTTVLRVMPTLSTIYQHCDSSATHSAANASANNTKCHVTACRCVSLIRDVPRIPKTAAVVKIRHANQSDNVESSTPPSMAVRAGPDWGAANSHSPPNAVAL